MRFWSERLGLKAWWKGLAVFALAALMLGCAATSRHVVVTPPPPARSPGPVSKVSLSDLPLTPPVPPVMLVAVQRPAVDVLIEQVELDLHEGKAAYNAGHLALARKHFDNAIKRLMASGFNFSVDPRLEPLMDRLISTMHDYQLKLGKSVATRTGVEAQQRQELPTAPPLSPLEEIPSSATFPANPALDEKAAGELLHVPHDLPLTVNKPVLMYLNFFETPRGRSIIEHSLDRAGRYMGMVRRILKQEGLPEDLMYLPLPESGYQPRAVSRVGARGLWQFMPGTGRLYGLKINQWEDQRMDPEASTVAAAQHLRDLYNTFHDWYLVLAAYDSGTITVAQAIARTGYADFWQLYRLNALPVETKNYVPIMLAMTLVAKDPSLYGIHVDPAKPIPMQSFRPGRSVDLRLVADAVGAKLSTLRELNPALFGVVTPNDSTYELHIPAGTLNRLRTTLASIPPSHWVGWRLHRVTPEDTLASVARRYHMRPVALAEANDISPGSSLAPGKLLLVPAPLLPAVIYYRVRPGDTLGGIAMRYHVYVRDLRIWNRLRSNLIRVGQLLRIYTRQGVARYEPVSRRRYRREHYPAHRGAVVHIAHWGDSFWSIARAYGVTVEELRRANPEISRRGLKVGDRVLIPAH